MSKRTVIIYEDWAYTIRELPDDQAIKVMKAMLGYAFYGETLDDVDQIAKAIVTPWCKEIDKNMASYKAKVENMNANRIKSQEKKASEKSARDQKEIISKDKDDDKDKDVVKKEKVKKEKSVAELLDESFLSPEVKLKVNTWLAYKSEQHKFSYKPIGFKSFLTEVANQESSLGSENVIKAIELSMSKGYKGIIWDLVNDAKSTNRVAQALDDSYRMINDWGKECEEGSDSVVESWG